MQSIFLTYNNATYFWPNYNWTSPIIVNGCSQMLAKFNFTQVHLMKLNIPHLYLHKNGLIRKLKCLG